YHIAKNQVTTKLYKAVMGRSSGGFGGPSFTWYHAMEFACKLSRMTGRNYRMITEAEWEYAVKNHSGSLEDIGENSMGGEEWAYNTWSTTHTGGTDPVGACSGQHTQKTRRDVMGTGDYKTGRLIRSIDGIGPALRLAISDKMDFPPGYVPPCDIHAPTLGDEPVNSYRDPRWVTGSEEHWTRGSIAIGYFDLRVWDDGTARLNGTNGQWFTSNNIAFVFVPDSGSIRKFAYIFLDKTQGSVLSETNFMSGGYLGRIVKKSANGSKPAISGLKSGAELAAAAGDKYKMIDMANIPASAKEQDSRLLDGPKKGWFQDNTRLGGLHHYRKDIDPDEFRFTVNQGQMIMLANGKWFTVNDTFLRVTHSNGYTCDYLYTFDSYGNFYHLSFQAYERADFRMFQLKSNSESFPPSCGSHCNSNIPKVQPASLYANMENGKSMFVPAQCPAGGCN
ncbi:MAG: SUMF1/EgtB/PvdO family nonheme iron enzyme, partial [Spirochaetes bacterium]|nr:SUMF1/EgtB/PvdO family nonheme iron enzyme [Spirochaetota bacterium]